MAKLAPHKGGFMIRVILFAAVLLMTGYASAEDMNCYVGLMRAEDTNENTDIKKTTALVSVDLKDDEGEKEIVVNGETIYVWIYKKEYADVYRWDLTLMTPEADRPPRSKFVAGMVDWLVNEGPARNDGFAPEGKKGAYRYEYLNRPAGSILITQKFKKALAAADLWGKHPFTSNLIDVNYAHDISETLTKLLKDGRLNPKDVVVLNTIFACTKNP